MVLTTATRPSLTATEAMLEVAGVVEVAGVAVDVVDAAAVEVVEAAVVVEVNVMIFNCNLH